MDFPQHSSSRSQSYVNHDQDPSNDAESYTSARLRTIRLSTSGCLLIFSVVLAGCGLAMMMMGFTLWPKIQEVKGLAVSGVFLISIGVGVGGGVWYVRKKARYEREHRMPVVTISLSQQTMGRTDSSILEGEYNTALDLPPEYGLATAGPSREESQARHEINSRPNYYVERNPVQTTHRVQGTAVDIQINSQQSTSITTGTSLSPAPFPSGTATRSSYGTSNHLHHYHNVPELSYTLSTQVYGETHGEHTLPLSVSSERNRHANASPAHLAHDWEDHQNSQETFQDLQTSTDSTSQTRSASADKVGGFLSVNADASLRSSDLDMSVASDDIFKSNEEPPPPSYFESVVENLDQSYV